MATYYERGVGQIEVDINVKGYPRMRKTFGTKTRARQWAEPIEAAMRAGTWQDTRSAKGMLLSEACELYKNKIAPRFKDVLEKCRMCDVLAKEFRGYTVLNLTPRRISEFRDKLKKRGLGASTVNHYINQLSAIYTALIKELHVALSLNPVKSVMRLRLPPARRQRVKDEIIEWLLRANAESNARRRRLGGPPLSGEFEPWLRLALESAMRRGEQGDLLIENVDLERRTALLPDTKAGEPREIALSSRATKLLRDLIAKAKPGQKKVFTLTKHGFATAYKRARAIVARKHPEVRRIRFHDVRREAASRLAKKLDIVELGNQTGHKKLDTLRIYYRPDPAEIAQKLD